MHILSDGYFLQRERIKVLNDMTEQNCFDTVLYQNR